MLQQVVVADRSMGAETLIYKEFVELGLVVGYQLGVGNFEQVVIVTECIVI